MTKIFWECFGSQWTKRVQKWRWSLKQILIYLPISTQRRKLVKKKKRFHRLFKTSFGHTLIILINIQFWSFFLTMAQCAVMSWKSLLNVGIKFWPTEPTEKREAKVIRLTLAINHLELCSWFDHTWIFFSFRQRNSQRVQLSPLNCNGIVMKLQWNCNEIALYCV